MTSLAFVIGVIAMFAAVLVLETLPSERAALGVKPAGLLRWIVSGNWPAKVGALLLIIGCGALLRYLLLQIELPPSTKLLGGVAASALLGLLAGLLKDKPHRRAIYLALGGTALGVAYLTAYSAYEFFHYIGEMESLGLLFAVAAGATVFALTSRALSIAMLAMVGAYLAPAFSLQTSGPVTVYGYYVLASTLALVMVALRGWRPLIHLSFIFTLAGGLFFGWTKQYYVPEFYSQMQPLLYLLTAIHLAMPLVEAWRTRSASVGVWSLRFDLGYFLLLPVTASLLTLLISPDAGADGAWGLLGLALLWFFAAGVERYRGGQGVLQHAGVALILLALAGLLGIGGASYFLLLAVAACVMLALGPRFGIPVQLNSLLMMVALSASACFLLQSLLQPDPLFATAQFVRHLLLASTFAVAGASLRKRGQPMASVFIAIALAWATTVGISEFTRMYAGNFSQALNLLLLAATAIYAVWVRWHSPRLAITIILLGGVFFTSLLSVRAFPATAILPLMLAGQLVFSLLAYYAGRHDRDGETVAGVSRSALPFLMFPWAMVLTSHFDTPHTSVVMTLLVASALFASFQAQLFLPRSRYWPNQFSPIGFVIFGVCILFQSLFYIQRQPWDVAFELMGLTYLASTLRFLLVAGNRDAKFFGLMTVLTMLAVSMAMLLRLVGPDEEVLTIFSLKYVLLPAMVSCIWAIIGAALTWWATRSGSRGMWTTGAVFLGLSAIKLVLFDFGSLGQLGNILAMMGAGAVFMLVAWLAPFPPKTETEKSVVVLRETVAPAERRYDASGASSANVGKVHHDPMLEVESPDTSGRIWLWILIGMLIFGGYILLNTLGSFARITSTTGHAGLVNEPVSPVAIARQTAPALTAAASSPASTEIPESRSLFVPADMAVADFSQEEWMRRYWAWTRSFLDEDNPSHDLDGRLCALGQSGDVWFLNGSRASGKLISRKCSIPAGKFIMVPVLNALIQPGPEPKPTCQQMEKVLREQTDGAFGLVLHVDGKQVDNPEQFRVRTGCFQLADIARNVTGPAAGEGFHAMLNPLPPGHHTLQFGGVYPDGFSQNITYELIVEELPTPEVAGVSTPSSGAKGGVSLESVPRGKDFNIQLPESGGSVSAVAADAKDVSKNEGQLKSFEFDGSDSRTTNPGICGFQNFKLPADVAVYAAGAYGGRTINFQIDQSGHQATQIDVAVHQTKKPVVLMLGAYEPTIWNIGWSAQTRIVAVVVSGYHRQAIAGLNKSVPVLNSSYDNKGACGYFYVSSEQNENLNPLARRLFGRTVDMVYPAQSGKVLIGDNLPSEVRLTTSSEITPQSYYDSSAQMAGPAGLEHAVRKGLLRNATPEDARAWAEARKAGASPRDVPSVAGQGIPKASPPSYFRGYVVLKPFVYPAGLYGGNSATFFIPKGVPLPTGNPGHSAVYDFNTLACSGALCRAGN